jgi:hypothetical protein
MTGKEKLEECIHRSQDKETKHIRRCNCRGGNYDVSGFFCNKKQLFDVKEENCKDCEEFCPKNK